MPTEAHGLAARRGCRGFAAIDSQRQHSNLSSAIRLFVLDFYRVQLSDAEEGHYEAQETTTQTARAYS